MKHNKLARLFIDFPILNGDIIRLSKENSHYLLKVLRLDLNKNIILFNGRDGEWKGIIKNTDKNIVIIQILSQLRQQTDLPKVWLIFSPIKAPRISFMIEKATELGVAGFIPIITDHSFVRTINEEKTKAWIREAAEQSERLSMPHLQTPISLKNLLVEWPSNKKIILCNERCEDMKLSEAFGKIIKEESFAILIGPEGGFSKDENDLLNSTDFVISAHLGPRILRSETASTAALSIYQSTLGDWNKGARVK